MIKGILLDIDNTVYRYDSANSKATECMLDFMSARLSIPKDDIRTAYGRARTSTHIELSGTASSHNRLLYIQGTLELLNAGKVSESLLFYNTYWDAFLSAMTLNEGVEDFLKEYADTTLCFITDLTAHIQHRKLEKLGLWKYTDYLTTSEEAGREKPHPQIFYKSLFKMQLRPDEVIMIGDSFDKDIVGATNLGIKSYWLNQDKKPLPRQHALISEVQSFCDLRGII